MGGAPPPFRNQHDHAACPCAPETRAPPECVSRAVKVGGSLAGRIRTQRDLTHAYRFAQRCYLFKRKLALGLFRRARAALQRRLGAGHWCHERVCPPVLQIFGPKFSSVLAPHSALMALEVVRICHFFTRVSAPPLLPSWVAKIIVRS